MIARTPETERAARHMLRTRLRWAGFGNIMPGVWLSPRSDHGDEVRQILDEARLPEGYLFTAEYQGGSRWPRSWAGPGTWTSWPASTTSSSRRSAGRRTVSPDPLARVIDLVHAWRRFPSIDPGLPPQFLPARWRGTAAAGLFARRHAQWTGDAIAEWKQLLART